VQFWNLLRLVAINVAVLIPLWLIAEFVAGQILPDPDAADKAFRIRDPIFSHGLRPNHSTEHARFGPLEFSYRTNSLGFRDAAVRDVPLASDGKRRRILFIGDSFTEGMGLAFADTFVGRFAMARPDLEVLNAAVSSYSPTVYYRKLKHLLELGLQFDEAVVYIDISDIQDEGLSYRLASDDTVLLLREIRECPKIGEPFPHEVAVADAKYRLSKALPLAHTAYSTAKSFLATAHKPDVGCWRDQVRSLWTVDSTLDGYGGGGVEGAIATALSRMDALAALLTARSISFSIGVYPWPDQLISDSVDSRQVSIWRDWCHRQKCARFINHFPDFFVVRDSDPDWYSKLFIKGDAHYNENGNALMARRLIAEFASAEAAPSSP
jgi:hypothetical protein